MDLENFEDFYNDNEEKLFDELKGLQHIDYITTICIIIGSFVFIIYLIAWFFSHETCIPCCYTCIRGKTSMKNNLIMIATVGIAPDMDYRIVRSYCQYDQLDLSINEYFKCLTKFDRMVEDLDESDRKLVDKLLNRYKFRRDPYRIIERAEREEMRKISEWNKLKKTMETKQEKKKMEKPDSPKEKPKGTKNEPPIKV